MYKILSLLYKSQEQQESESYALSLWKLSLFLQLFLEFT